MAWLTAVSTTLDANNAGSSHLNVRSVIPTAAISNAGLPLLRVTFIGGTSEGFSITSCYIGQKADAGDTWDFQTTPSQLLFGGAANVTIGAGASVVSDTKVFTIPVGKDLIIAFYVTSTANDTVRYKTAVPAGWYSCYKDSGSDESGTANVTGYSDWTGSSVGFNLIEVSTPPSGEQVTDLSGYGRLCKLVKEKAKKYYQGWSLKNGIFQPEPGLSF